MTIDKETLLKSNLYKQPYQQEKNYLQDLFLSAIYNCFDDSLVFKGGTALSKFYGSVLFSDNIDFSMDLNKISVKEVEYRIEDVIKGINISYSTKTLRKSAKGEMVVYELSIRGPLFEMLNKYQHLKIEIDKKTSVIERANAIRINPIYPDISPYIAVVMAEKEILAEKIVALLFRSNPKARDLYDLYFLIEKGTEIKISLVDKKMREYGHTFTQDKFNRRMAAIEKTWNKELRRLLLKTDFVTYRLASKKVTECLKEATLL